jgi:hypothetical protein
LVGSEKEALGPATARVEFARNPKSGEWQLFAADGATLTTAPVDPRTGKMQGPPVRLLDGLGFKVSPSRSQFMVANGGVIAWRHYSGALPIWRMCWFDRNGNVTGVIGERRGYVSIALSPDETKIVTLESETGSSRL